MLAVYFFQKEKGIFMSQSHLIILGLPLCCEPFPASQGALWISDGLFISLDISTLYHHNTSVKGSDGRAMTKYCYFRFQTPPDMRYFISLLCLWHGKCYCTLSSLPSTYIQDRQVFIRVIKRCRGRQKLQAGMERIGRQQDNLNPRWCCAPFV